MPMSNDSRRAKRKPPYLLDKIYAQAYISRVSWEVEYTEGFEAWWDGLAAELQERLTAAIEKLQESGPALGRPYVDTLKDTQLSNLKELRAAAEGSHLMTNTWPN